MIQYHYNCLNCAYHYLSNSKQDVDCPRCGCCYLKSYPASFVLSLRDTEQDDWLIVAVFKSRENAQEYAKKFRSKIKITLIPFWDYNDNCPN